MINNTLFTYFKHQLSLGDDTDPDTSGYFNMPPFESVQNVTAQAQGTLFLDEGDSVSIPLSGLVGTDWIGVVARVMGEAAIRIQGADFDAAPIDSYAHGYGAGRHTGFMSLSSIGVTSISIVGLADETVVQYIAMKFIPDNSL